jgi:hypothetical protein
VVSRYHISFSSVATTSPASSGSAPRSTPMLSSKRSGREGTRLASVGLSAEPGHETVHGAGLILDHSDQHLALPSSGSLSSAEGAELVELAPGRGLRSAA